MNVSSILLIIAILAFCTAVAFMWRLQFGGRIDRTALFGSAGGMILGFAAVCVALAL
jgi:hypothetical protein